MLNNKAAGFTHDKKNNLTVDWWTPKWIFDSLSITFDLDPAAPIGGVPWIPAKNHYTQQDDGLFKPWNGRVWLNPPYGKHTADWLAKMHEHRNGIALVFARTDCRWFHYYVARADAILFLKGRISFVDAKKNNEEPRRWRWVNVGGMGECVCCCSVQYGRQGEALVNCKRKQKMRCKNG